MHWLDRLPFALLLAATLFLGLAPFSPEPHVVEKLRMLASGNLHRSLDIFDLCFHLLPLVLLLLKLSRTANRHRTH